MKINHVDGNIVDTDKLSDINSMIMEKAEELRILCCNSKIQMALSIGILNKENKAPSVSFWNIKTPDFETNSNEGWNKFFGMINAFVYLIWRKKAAIPLG